MIRSIGFAAAIFLLSAGSPAHADGALSACWDTDKETTAFHVCLDDLQRQADNELAAAYAEALEGIAPFDEIVGQRRASRSLERGQKAFELYRDLDCAAQGMMAGPLPAGERFYQACWIDRTRGRIAALETFRPADPATVLAGDWRVMDVGGVTAAHAFQPTLTFQTDGNVGGHGGCNRFFGTVRFGKDALEFGPLGATRMACGEALDGKELAYLRALEKVQDWTFDPDGTLVLTAADGSPLVRLDRVD